MTVLRLDTAAQIFHGGAEVTEVWHGGARIWENPATPPASIFSLTTPQSRKSGFTVSSATDTGVTLDRTATGRSWISWQVSWPVGSRIVFDWTTANPATGVWCSLDDVIGISSPTYNAMQNVSGGSGQVDFTIPGGGWSYFGWSINKGQATGLLTIRNFAVYAP